MGKKGSKRKTQWRTLSLGTPPGEDDDDEAKKPAWSGYKKGHEPWRSGYSDGGSRHRGGSSDLPSQPKVIFNEEEYTRITTPRQDILFKKGYLTKSTERKTSATSSTTGSQSASHSTADGSETTEYQQLLDRDCRTPWNCRSSRNCRTSRECGMAKYAPALPSNTELNYSTYYDHTGGYYYYPVMVVGPAPVSTQVAPNVLAAVPCGPVPLRPVEWINPIFMPKVPGQPYRMMDCKDNQSEKDEEVTEKYEDTELPTENYEENCDENGTGSASYSGSVVYEIEEQPVETNNEYEEKVSDEVIEEPTEDAAEEETYENEQQFVEEQTIENGVNEDAPYYDPLLMGQPVHVSHVIPTAPQSYMYPGHYMFGPPLINVNGVTIQGGPMMRSMDMAAMWTACSKPRKKKKRWRQEKHAADNVENDKETECSSEHDTTGMSSFPQCCTTCSASTTTNCRPLNPECQEFQLRQAAVESYTSIPSSSPTNSINSPASDQSSMNRSNALSSDTNFIDNDSNDTLDGDVSDNLKNPEDKLTESTKSNLVEVIESDTPKQTLTLVENGQAESPETTEPEIESNRLTNCCPETVKETITSTEEVVHEVEKLPNAIKPTIANESSSINDLRPSNEMNGREALVNGKLNSNSSNEDALDKVAKPKTTSSLLNDEKTKSWSVTPKSIESVTSREDQNHESLANNKLSTSNSLSKRKYSAKGAKFVREPTPGPDLDSAAEIENDANLYDRTQSLEKTVSNDSKATDLVFDNVNDNKISEDKDQLTNNKFAMDKTSARNHLSKEEAIDASNEDSGFESQTRLSDYPITEAVTEWLRREQSPDLFITSSVSMDCEEDEEEMDEEPPKNLHGNPMPALSANSVADNALSCGTSYSEFARFNNLKGVQQEQGETGNNGASRRKKDAKKRSEERRRVARHAVEGRMDHEVVSSSDSCGQQEDLMNNSRRKNNLVRPQQDVVGDLCELTEKDSVVGMRVASSSRMDSKRVNARRTKRQGRLHVRNSVNNMETKIKRIEDVDDEDDVDADDNIMNVKTYEKGEIVVSEDGKLLTTSVYEPSLRNHHDLSTAIKVNTKCEASKLRSESRVEDNNKRSSSSEEDEENCSVAGSLGSIEEPDVLEFWEAEIIEPVITPKRILQSEGVLCEGEAAEDDAIEVEQVNVEYVQKYYRLAQGSTTSIEEEMNSNADPTTSSKSVPKSVQKEEEGGKKEMEEIPIGKELPEDKNNIPIDEAFEVYESCYTGKPPYLVIDPKIFKSRTLYGQEGEGPIPCRAVCCHIQ